MTTAPEASVVMSVYNGATCLHESMDSILSQEGVSLEFIIVDDGSADETGQILRDYESRDPRVKVISQENTGLTKALIRGCAAARGQYIARQDVGDVSHPQRLLLQKEALAGNSELAFVSCWTEYYGPQWEFLYVMRGTGAAKVPAFIISESEKHWVIDGPSHHGSVMFRKEHYFRCGGYRPEFYYGQDWDLWYRLAEIGRFLMLEKPLYRVRILPGSISGTSKRRQEEFASLSLSALQLRRRGLDEQDVLKKAAVIRGENGHRNARFTLASQLYFIGELLRRNEDSRCVKYFKESLRLCPFKLNSWLRLLQSPHK